MRADELSMKSCDLCNVICVVLRIIICSNRKRMLFVRNYAICDKYAKK